MKKSHRMVMAFLLPLTVGIVGFFMRAVFAGTVVVDPVGLKIGPVEIRWYGILMASAISVAYEWSRRRLIVRGFDEAQGTNVLWWAAIGGLLGARLGFVIQNGAYFFSNLNELFAVTNGGLSIHGAVLGGALAVWLASRGHTGSELGNHTPGVKEAALRWSASFLDWADIIAPTVLLGAIIGRFGNFLNYELYGYPTDVAWKMFVPLEYRLPGFEASVFFHPTFLYEALLNILMVGLILWYERRMRQLPTTNYQLHSGSIFFLTIALYSVSRFIVEFFRIGTEIGAGLTLAQWVSLAIIVSSLIVLTRHRARRYNLIKN